MNRSLTYPILENDATIILEKSNLEVVSCGHLYYEESMLEHLPNLFYHRVILINKGNAKVTKRNVTYEVGENSMVYLKKNESMEFNVEKGPVSINYICFKIDEDSFGYYKQYEIYPWTQPTSICIDGMQEVILEASRGYDCNRLKVEALLTLMLIELMRASNMKEEFKLKIGSTEASSASLYHQAYDYITHNLKEAWKIQNVVNHLNISASYLYQIFVKHTGQSPQNFIQQYRIEVAKDALRYKKIPIKQIAYDVGFSSANHFSAFFKLHMHQTPKEYRSNIEMHAKRIVKE